MHFYYLDNSFRIIDRTYCKYNYKNYKRVCFILMLKTATFQ